MICFGSLERDYSLSTGDMTLKKGLRSQHGKDVQLHDSLGSPRPVNELRGTTCTHNLRLPLVRRILNEATNMMNTLMTNTVVLKYLKYPDAFICFYCVLYAYS